MTTPRLPILLLLLALVGCAEEHPPVVETPGPLAACLGGDARLETLATIDNNDRLDHGGIVSSALAPTGRLVVGSTDGALKTWTIDGDFLGAGGGEPAVGYGAESPPGTTPAMDVAFDADAHTVWAVDASGFLAAWDTDALDAGPRTFFATDASGASVGAPASAVAVGGGFAMAAFRTGDSAVNNVVWTRTDAAGGPLPLQFSYMDTINAIVFTGSEFIAVGTAFDGAALNHFVISSEPPAEPLTGFSINIPGREATSAALSPDGEWLAIGGDSFVAVVPTRDAGLGELMHVELDHPVSSLSFSTDGAHLVAIDALSTLRAFDAHTLEPGLVQELPSARRIARHPSAPALVVTRSDGFVDVMGCAAL